MIDSKSGQRIIFREPAQQVGNSKRFMLEIPEDFDTTVQEEYYIIFEDKDGESTRIDPYLIIPNQ